VAKADKETHEAEEHKIQTCIHGCGFQAMKSELASHSASCEMQPVACKICSQPQKPNEMNEHLQLCGSKTYKCERCQEYVKMLEKDIHVNEGFCDAFYFSKQELDEKETQKQLEKFQQ
jgi:hypothetical protein